MRAMTALMRINHSDVEFHTQMDRTCHHCNEETDEYVVFVKKFVGNDIDCRMTRNPMNISCSPVFIFVLAPAVFLR